MCTSTAFILETNRELDGAYERELISANDFQECSNFCLNSLEDRGFLCRSFVFDDGSRICLLYDEDPLFYGEIGQDPRSMNQQAPRRPLKSSAGNLYRVLCVSPDRGENQSLDLRPILTLIKLTQFCPLSQTEALMALPHTQANIPACRTDQPRCTKQALGVHTTPAVVMAWIKDYLSHTPVMARNMVPGTRGQDSDRTIQKWEVNMYPPATSPSGLQYGGSHPPQSVDRPPPMPPAGGGPPPMMPPMPSTPSFGIPYNSQPPAPFPPPPHPNAIGPGAPFMPGQFSPDRCQFPVAGGPPAPYSGSVRFNRLGFGTRLRSMYITKITRAERQEDCERECVETREFTCRSFNYRSFFPAENCELSQYDSKQLKLENPQHFEQHTQFDYYERDPFTPGQGMVPGSAGPSGYSADCLEVAQTCTPDGMEFTVKTPEGFHGRIYTYGFYDSCFYDGNGGTVNVLRISRANGFPRCGTQQYGDAMTNIVVVQFNDYVQTSRDKKYNLTCYFSGPGEAVVTSNYLDAKTDA